MKTPSAVYFSVPSTPNLVVDGKINAKLIDGRDLVADYASEATFVSEKGRASFDRNTKGVEWHAVKASDGTSWFRMKVTEVLPEPIEIANPQEVTPNEEPADTVSVLSDGNDRITPANIEALAKVGLAVSDKVLAGGTLHRWRPTLVASGALLKALGADGALGVPEAYPLVE